MKRALAILLFMGMMLSGVCQPFNKTACYAETNQQTTTYAGENFRIEYQIVSQWNQGYIANVTIFNTGSTTIENWELSYQSADEYVNIWNASVDYRGANYYNIKNAGHNQNIRPGESVSFGFQAAYKGESVDIPQSYKILGDRLVVNNKECRIQFDVVNQWHDGCIMNATLYNNSDKNIENWSMEYGFDFEIPNIWRAKIESRNGNTYKITNCEYNSVIRPGESETFGMQIHFPEGAEFKKPYDIKLYQYRKDDWYLDFDKEWNRTMIRANDETVLAALQKNKNTIKIGVIDSGIDYSSNIKVAASENFVTAYTEKNPIFGDLSGHGTAVAGILASDPSRNEDSYQFDNKYLKQLTTEKVNGINPYVKLYSAEVLDESNKTTVDQLVNGINWAVEKGVKILNISCGLEKDSAKLHNAIKNASAKGILIVAAAGDGKTVQYPAKYEEVMAVGSVKCNGEQTGSSPTGNEIEVVAPGEDVTTYGPFEILANQSGTSMAAPQVSALAAILWQQDPSQPADFIRKLIDASAHPLGEPEKYGYGLIDCAYALEQYETFAEGYHAAGTEKMSLLADNDHTLLLTDEEVVRGYWSGDEHKVLAKNRIAKFGAVWPDRKESTMRGMKDHPEFHGYYKKDYVNAYITMTKVASKLYKDGKFPKSKGDFYNNIKETANLGFKFHNIKKKEDKANFVYGMALHTVADIFSHSTAGVKGNNRDSLKKKSLISLCKQWKVLKHGPKKKDGTFYADKNFADSTKCISSRYNKSAKRVCGAIINQAVSKYKSGNKKVFENIYYYKSVKKALKIKKESDKKNYVIKSYGILNLTKYLKPGKNTKLNSVINNAGNANIKKVVEGWK